jgi:DNA-binding NtrC family response regulator
MSIRIKLVVIILFVALAAIKINSFEVVLIDKNLPGRSGLELLREVRSRCPLAECMIITGYSSLESAVEAMKLGACDYITKTFDHIGHVVSKVDKAIQRRRQCGRPEKE